MKRINWYLLLECLILGAILFCLAAIGQSQNCPVQGCPTGIHGLVYTGPGNHWDPCSGGNDPYKAGLFSLDPLTFTNDARTVNTGIQYGVLPIYVVNAVQNLNRSTSWDFLSCQQQQDIVAASNLIAANPTFGTNLSKTKVQWFTELWLSVGCTQAPQPPFENPPAVPVPVPCSPTPVPTRTPVPPTPPPTQTPIVSHIATQTPTPPCQPCLTPTPTPSCPACPCLTPGRSVISR